MKFKTAQQDNLVINNDAVCLDFVKGEYSHNFNFSRPLTSNTQGMGTTYNAQGNIDVVLENQPRILYDPVTHENLGVIIEAEIENLASSPEFWGRTSSSTLDPAAVITANSNMAMYESPETIINTQVAGRGIYRGLRYADLWLSGTSNTTSNLNIVMNNSLANFGQADIDIDGTLGYTPPVLNLVHTRASVGYTFDYRGFLFAAAANVGRFYYDPTANLNLVENPLGDGGCPGTTFTPKGWGTIGGGLTATFVQRGMYPDGTTFIEYYITGTSNGNAQNILVGVPSDLTQRVYARPNEYTFSAAMTIEVIETNVDVSMWLNSFNSSGSIINSNAHAGSIITPGAGPIRTTLVNKVLTNSNAVYAGISVRLNANIAGLNVVSRIRISAPLLTQSSTLLTDTVPYSTITERTPIPLEKIGLEITTDSLSNSSVWSNTGYNTAVNTGTQFRNEDVYDYNENASTAARRVELIGAYPTMANNEPLTFTFNIKPVGYPYFSCSTTSTGGNASFLAVFGVSEEAPISIGGSAGVLMNEINKLEDGWFQVIMTVRAAAAGTMGIMISGIPEKNTARVGTFPSDTTRKIQLTRPKLYRDYRMYYYSLNMPKYGLKGQLLEEAYTNLSTNPQLSGGANQVMTTSGNTTNIPTNYQITWGDANLVYTVTTGTDSGIPCMDLTITGTAGAANQAQIIFGNDPTALPGNQVSASVFLRISGTGANVHTLSLIEQNATVNTSNTMTIETQTAAAAMLSLNKCRRVLTRTFSNANTNSSRTTISIGHNAGAVNLSVRFAGMQTEVTSNSSPRPAPNFLMMNANNLIANSTKSRDYYGSSGVQYGNAQVGTVLTRLAIPEWGANATGMYTAQGTLVFISNNAAESHCFRVVTNANDRRPIVQKRVNSVQPVGVLRTNAIMNSLVTIAFNYKPGSVVVSHEGDSTTNYSVDTSVGADIDGMFSSLRFNEGQGFSGGNMILNRFKMWHGKAASNTQIYAMASRGSVT